MESFLLWKLHKDSRYSGRFRPCMVARALGLVVQASHTWHAWTSADAERVAMMQWGVATRWSIDLIQTVDRQFEVYWGNSATF